MMLDDAPTDKKQTKDYRKALRDLPQDFPDPREIVIPEPPS
jgi:hypothetical protein